MNSSVFINTVLLAFDFKILNIYYSMMCIINIIIMYYNVLIATCIYNTFAKAKSLEIKQSISAFWLHIGCSLVVVNFSKIHI